MTGQCHQICQHHDNVPSLTTSPAPPVIRHKAGRYWALELETKVHGDFTITEMASTMAFSLEKVPTNTFAIKNLLRHYAKLSPKKGK